MGKKSKNPPKPLKNIQKTPEKIDKWAQIEHGNVKSAAQLLYHEPSNEPKFVHPSKKDKIVRINAGNDGVERVLVNFQEKKTAPKKRALEVEPKASKKSKIDLTSVQLFPKKKAVEELIVLSSDDDEDYEEEEEIEEIDEEEEVEEEEDEIVETPQEIEFELDNGEEEEDEMTDEDVTEIDEEEMMINSEDIASIVSDEEGEDEEDEEEEEGDSDVSGMDADSDDEGFIAGKDREAHVIHHKSKKSLGGAPIDFDKFPFSQEDSVVTATRAFGFIVGNCDVQKFFEDFYQSNILVIHRNNKNYYGNLFSVARFVELMEKNHLEYGENINIAEYKNGERMTLNGKGRVYPQIVKQHISSLHSIQLVNPQTFDTRIWYLCEILQDLFGCFVGANTYLTPAGSSGFAPHWDEIDAFLLQVEGRKYWRVWAPESSDDELPLESSGNFSENDMKGRVPSFEGWIEAGDMLYIPRGFIHQARTDENIHSLHVTVSTGRQWSFANLLEKVIPQAVTALSETSHKLRRGLPIGLFDMSGVADLDYSQAEHFTAKFRIPFDRHMSKLRNLVADNLAESAVDIMAREFMKGALPPMLTPDEKKWSVLGSSINLLDDELVEFNAKTKVKLVRKHTQRLLMESEDTCYIAHRMSNSRQFEGRPEQLADFPFSGVDVFTILTDAYPEWRTLDTIFSSKLTKNVARKEQLAAVQALYSIGVLLVRN